ncbi:hypothetical protein ACFLRF_05270 [Candidatus Altiarchaeota archaeon]
MNELLSKSVKGVGGLMLAAGFIYGLLGSYLFFNCFTQGACSLANNLVFFIFIPSGIMILVLSSILGGSWIVHAIPAALLWGIIGFTKGTILLVVYQKAVSGRK